VWDMCLDYSVGLRIRLYLCADRPDRSASLDQPVAVLCEARGEEVRQDGRREPAAVGRVLGHGIRRGRGFGRCDFGLKRNNIHMRVKGALCA